MSTLKYQANLANSTSQYNAYLGAGGFRGVDVSDDPSKINGTRFANATNMWKDYENQSGIAVETMPGYRKLKSTNASINGIFRYVYNIGEVDEQRYVVVHSGGDLWVYTWQDFMNGNTEVHYVVSKGDSTIKNEKSNAFQYRNRFFILQNGYWELIRTESDSGVISFSIQNAYMNGYTPTTFIDGVEYEQANALSDYVINKYNDLGAPIDDITIVPSVPSYNIPLYNRLENTLIASANIGIYSPNNFIYHEQLWYKRIPTDNKYYIVRITSNIQTQCGISFYAKPSEESDETFNLGEKQFTLYSGETKTFICSMEMVPQDYIATFELSPLNDIDATVEVSVVDFEFTQSFLASETEVFDNIHWVGDEDITASGTGASDKKADRSAQTGIFFYPRLINSNLKSSTISDEFTSLNLFYRITDTESTTKNTTLPIGYSLSIKYKAVPTSFTSAGEYAPFSSSHSVSMSDAINGCKLFDIFDDRIFLSGNPKLPNTIFYANRDNTGYVNPTYFGVLNWFDCGVSNEPITAMVHNANNLIVLKGNTIQDSVISFYTPWQTQQDIIPKAYIRNDGLPGKGCIGFACNLRDDIVFLSETGLEGIDRQTVNTERAIGHRSSLVDAKLLAEDLSKAMYCEWKDYLVILFPSGNAYLADTRQVSSVNGYSQYEWYLLNDIVTWTDDGHPYNYASAFPSVSSNDDITSCAVNGIWNRGEYITKSVDIGGVEQSVDFCILHDYSDTRIESSNIVSVESFTFGDETWYCLPAESTDFTIETPNLQYIVVEKQEELVCGAFGANGTETKVNYPTVLTELNGLMIFGTDNGDICVFNTDKRGVRPERLKDEYTEQEYKSKYSTTIDAEWYDRCGHAYLSGIETAFDNANVPHLTKDTIKKSCVVEVKLGITSSFSSQFRTDRDGWSKPSLVSIRNNDFSDNNLFKADFTTNSNAALAVTEKTKKWVVKQYRMYSDKWRTPFGIYGIAYRYSIHGRIKN